MGGILPADSTASAAAIKAGASPSEVTVSCCVVRQLLKSVVREIRTLRSVGPATDDHLDPVAEVRFCGLI